MTYEFFCFQILSVNFFSVLFWLQCRDIGLEMQEEILRTLHELHTTMKTHHSYQTECRQAEAKLRLAENQRLKMEQNLPKEKLDRSKKYKLIGKEVQKVSAVSRKTPSFLLFLNDLFRSHVYSVVPTHFH